jgi:Family of unknown function (DUF6062)
VTEKYIGYFRLVEACDGPGCPVCAYLEQDSRRQLAILFDEHVTDVATRRRLRASWGICNWHTWMVRDTRPTATGVAIVYEDLLRICRERLDMLADPRWRPVAGLRHWLRGLVNRTSRRAVPDPVIEYRERPRCALCAQLRLTEAHCLDAVLRFAHDPDFERAYQRSAGLCVPHLLGAVERGSGTPASATIVERTLGKWQAVRDDLGRFVAKHEYRNADAIRPEEARSYERVLEILAGRRGLFGSDMRSSPR